MGDSVAVLGRVPVLKARMNPDLQMAADLKTTTSAITGPPGHKFGDVVDRRNAVEIHPIGIEANTNP